MRYDIYRSLGLQQDLNVYDILSIDFSKFVVDSSSQFYLVTTSDVLKPWFISQKFYGTTDYTDFLLQINGIVNPLEDLKPDMLLAIPAKSSIKDFLLKNKNFI